MQKFLQNFFKPVKQILLLALFQCIVSDFFTRASNNFDTGTNHFLVKTPFTGCHTDSFYLKLVDHRQKLQLNFIISSKYPQANETNTCFNSFPMYCQ